MDIQDMKDRKAYQSYSTEELRHLLNQDISCPEQQKLPVEDVLYITQIVMDRELAAGQYQSPNVDAAWSDFQNAFLNNPDNSKSRRSAHTPVRFTSFYKHCVCIAAVICIFIGTMITAQALGVDIWGPIARWTSESFHFEVFSRDADNETDYSQIELTENSLPKEFVPGWIPEGFEVEETKLMSNSQGKSFYISFSGEGDAFFSIILTKYESLESVNDIVFEKSDTNVETYVHDDKVFYIFPNEGTYTAAWSGNLLVYQISGNLSRDDLIKIIDCVGE